MTADRYLRLEQAPALNHPGNPSCGACDEETSPDDGSWMCHSCGTTWPIGESEYAAGVGELYSSWSGKELTGPICPPDLAWQVSHLPPDERDQRIRQHLEGTQ